MRQLPALAVVVLGATLLPSDASAVCSCMLEPRPPPSTSATGEVARDPGYTPTAAVFVTRQGTHTVLTIETAYQGPARPMSMVLPVPTAIERDQVRTVRGSLFRTLDRRTAPRVRHVWPACERRRRRARPMAMSADSVGGGGGGGPEPLMRIDEYGVDIEDEWELDEYDMTLLGAEQSTGLLAFLRERGLSLPDVAAEVLRAYIESGHRFILVDVDPSRAHRLGDNMMLSPIQLEYDSEELRVPVRLGTLNSPGEQELLLYVLSDEGRYEIANREMLVAPSDLEIDASARGGVAELYRAISDEMFRRHPGAAVTEYAHVLNRQVNSRHVRDFGLPQRSDTRRRRTRGSSARWTLTRIRHRYGTELDDDLTLRPAEEPLRLTRRWRHRSIRTYAPRGHSGFHIQYVAVHRGRTCPGAATQRRYARRFATAESLWEADRDLWPGVMLRDPIASLEIEPGSAAPDGWPPPPPEVQPPPIARTDGAMEPLQPRDAVDEPEPSEPVAEAPAAAPAAPSASDGGCTATPGRGGVWWGLLGLLGLFAFRARARGPRR